MKGAALLLLFATIALLFWRYRRGDSVSKLVLAIGWLMSIVACASLLPMFRPIVPLFVFHMVALVLSWAGVVLYLATGRMVWWFFIAPIATLLIFVGLSLIEGSRYEEIRTQWVLGK